MPRAKKQPTTHRKNGPPAPPAEVLTLSEAAAYLRVDEATVLRLVREQALPGRQLGPDWRFLKPAMQEWLRSGPARTGLLAHAGAIPNDEETEEFINEIYRRRRSQVEEP